MKFPRIQSFPLLIPVAWKKTDFMEQGRIILTGEIRCMRQEARLSATRPATKLVLIGPESRAALHGEGPGTKHIRRDKVCEESI